MIVVMQPDATSEQIAHAMERVEELGMKAILLKGTNRTVIAAIGDKRETAREVLGAIPGVERTVPILAPYKVASVEAKKERSVVRIGSGSIGGQQIGVIAGPCSVESREQILECAHAVKAAGAIGLRGGAFKPRTNPYSFQGLGEEGLKLLAEAREQTGLAVVTEVLSPEQVGMVADYADVLQVGARNMQNFHLLREVGKTNKPVLLKRGFAATLDEFLLAAEYILAEGNSQVMLCERGIRTFEDHTRNTLCLSAVPALNQRSHLPVVVDPSQGTGVNSLVTPMARAAVAAGADSLIIEVHPDPEHALTDGAQSITIPEFELLMNQCRPIAQAVGREM
ncbi:MAG: 3-deoxy-7-phosphoheptulonate synthase [Planctomycetota bacterium]|nr:3-deoxy-7-phosphoheptulonate synthase [Planctomycetota bacterium]MDA1139317.1 3-deoxy-7-phosphoheptulonate synthase [Planctomycetota bacterium]